MSAIFLHSDNPPAAQVSGWMMSTARDDQQVAKAEARELAFAAGDRDRKRGFHRPVSRHILGRHRLLEPSDVVRLDHPAETDRGDGVVGMVGIDHQSDIGPDRLPHRARHRGILLDAEADLELHRLKSVRDIAGRLLGEIPQRIAGFAPVETGRIGLHLGAQRAAEQAVHGHAKMLSLDIPQRDVDAAQPLDDDAFLPVIAEPGIDHLPQKFGPQRILADQPWRDAVWTTAAVIRAGP